MSHAADYVADGDDVLFMARSLLLANSVGMALGPLLGGELFANLGGDGLFVLSVVVTSATGAYAAARALRSAPRPEGKRRFVPIHETTPAELGMDPRLPSPDGLGPWVL